MKKNPTIQEILLVTTTTFSKRQLCEINSSEGNGRLAPEEQLEASCWNGLLDQILPAIMHQSPHAKKLFLWQAEMKIFLYPLLNPNIRLCRMLCLLLTLMFFLAIWK